MTRKRRSRSRATALAVAAALLSSAPAGAEDEKPQWEEINREDGIAVFTREVPGREMPTFKGVGMINAGMLEILAVFRDTQRHCEWMHACMESRILHRFQETEAILYNRVDAPWPISDRDVVLHAKLTPNFEKREAWSRFSNITSELKPEVDGVVRMPMLQGFWHLEYVSLFKTRATYQVNADPGGSLPTWIAKIATRDLPHRTITNLRKQVWATRGQYDGVIARWIREFDLDTRYQRPKTAKKPVDPTIPRMDESGSATPKISAEHD